MARFTDIGSQRFIRGKYYYITSIRIIDITRSKVPFVQRVNVFQFYIKMFKARLKDAIK